MKNHKSLLLAPVLVLLSLLLAACGSSSSRESNFPTGKFIKSGEPNHGLIFNEGGRPKRLLYSRLKCEASW